MFDHVCFDAPERKRVLNEVLFFLCLPFLLEFFLVVCLCLAFFLFCILPEVCAVLLETLRETGMSSGSSMKKRRFCGTAFSQMDWFSFARGHCEEKVVLSPEYLGASWWHPDAQAAVRGGLVVGGQGVLDPWGFDFQGPKVQPAVKDV